MLVHECVHRLIAKNLIPSHIYDVFYRSGYELIKKHPFLKDNIFNRKDKHSTKDECVTTYVQLFYRENSCARNYLINKPVSLYDRFVDFIQELKERWKASHGDEFCQARIYLRMIERNELIEPSLSDNINIINDDLWKSLHSILNKINIITSTLSTSSFSDFFFVFK